MKKINLVIVLSVVYVCLCLLFLNVAFLVIGYPGFLRGRKLKHLDKFEVRVNQIIDREELQEWADRAMKENKPGSLIEQDTFPQFLSELIRPGLAPHAFIGKSSSHEAVVCTMWRTDFGFCGIVIGPTNKYLILEKGDRVMRHLNTNMVIYVAR